MRTRSFAVEHTRYASGVVPEASTEDPELAKAIALADENPHVGKIVTETRSKAFGGKSCFYIGWAQNNNAADAILERVRST